MILQLNLMNLDHLINNLYNPERGWDEFNYYSIYHKRFAKHPCKNATDALGINAYLSGANISLGQLFVIQFGYCISLKNSPLHLFKY